MATKPSTIKNKLDKVFSEYIRLRDSDGNTASCVSCGAVKPWREQQCGHLVSRRHLATRWDEHNAAAQCYACNVLRNGNTAYMMREMEARFGKEAIDEVIRKSRAISKLGINDLRSMLKELEDGLRMVRRMKGMDSDTGSYEHF